MSFIILAEFDGDEMPKVLTSSADLSSLKGWLRGKPRDGETRRTLWTAEADGVIFEYRHRLLPRLKREAELLHVIFNKR